MKLFVGFEDYFFELFEYISLFKNIYMILLKKYYFFKD